MAKLKSLTESVKGDTDDSLFEEREARLKVEVDTYNRRLLIAEKIKTGLDVQAPFIETTFAAMIDLMGAWFTEIQGFDRIEFGYDIALMHSELSEALEADRNDCVSDHIPEFHGREEEIADLLVRAFHVASKYQLRLGPAFIAKMRMNFTRPVKHGKGY